MFQLLNQTDMYSTYDRLASCELNERILKALCKREQYSMRTAAATRTDRGTADKG